MDKCYKVIIGEKEVCRFKSSCMYYARIEAKNYLILNGYNPRITNYTVREI